jgi:RNA-splicing ligase RtcB
MMASAMMVMDEYNLTESAAYAVVRNSMKLFGDVAAADKKGLTHILTEVLTDVMKKAIDRNEFGTAVEAARQIAKIQGLPMEEVKKKDKVLPKFIIPTSSEGELKKQMAELEKEQYIEFEEDNES